MPPACQCFWQCCMQRPRHSPRGSSTHLLTSQPFLLACRIRKTVAKIVAAKGKSTQGRLESFFGPATIKPKADAGAAAAKRKGAPAAAKGAANKKGKLGGVGGKKK
jgi:hypothetical protein